MTLALVALAEYVMLISLDGVGLMLKADDNMLTDDDAMFVDIVVISVPRVAFDVIW